MKSKLLNVGFGNAVLISRVVAILSPVGEGTRIMSVPLKRLKDEAEKAGKLIDVTMGRRTRSIIITDTDHVILSAVHAETLAQRLDNGEGDPVHIK